MEKRAARLCGLSLEQFAGVMAATAEHFALREVLAQENIKEAVWVDAERAWSVAIAESTDLQMQLIQKRRIAEECLSRKIEPLDSDAGAWVGVLGELATASDPDSFVASLGLTMGDVARLGRSWRKKAESDVELAKRLVDLAATAKAPQTVTAEPACLQPFPWTPKRSKRDETTTKPAEATVAVADELPKPAGPKRVLASYQLREQARAEASIASPPVIAVPVVVESAAQHRAPADLSATFGDETGMMPQPEAVRRMIAEADPCAALARAAHASLLKAVRDVGHGAQAPDETGLREGNDAVGGGTAMAPQPAEIARLVKESFPFKGSPSDTEPVGNETAMMPMPDVVKRLIADAEPRAAMARAPAVAREPQSATHVEEEDVGSGTAIAPPPAEIARLIKHSFPFDAGSGEPRSAYLGGPDDPNESQAAGPTLSGKMRQNMIAAETRGGPTLPALTLERYAELRAALALAGEEHTPTWEAFGVASTGARSALREAFAALFQRDPAAQARFVELVREARRALNRR